MLSTLAFATALVGSAPLIEAPLAEAPLSEPKLEAKLSVDKPFVTQEGDAKLTLVLKNTGKAPIQIGRPRDGSIEGWINPIISFTDVVRESGEDAPPIFRCGNCNPLVAEDYVSLAPGKGLSFILYSPWLSRGKNTFTVQYEVRKDKPLPGGVMLNYGDAGPAPELLLKYRSLTPVKTKSNAVTITLVEAP